MLLSEYIQLVLDGVFVLWLSGTIVTIIIAVFKPSVLRSWMVFRLIIVPASVIWFRLWMYYGWFGAPDVLHHIFLVDGESGYDAVLLEMIIMLCLIFVFAELCIRCIFKKKLFLLRCRFAKKA